MPQLPSQPSRAHEPQPLKPKHLERTLSSERSHHSEKPAQHHQEQPLLTATRESLRAAAKTQRSRKSIGKTKKNVKIHLKKTFLVSELSEVPRKQSHNLVRSKPAMQDVWREAGKPALWLLTSSRLIQRFGGRKTL